jgi:Transketolase
MFEEQLSFLQKLSRLVRYYVLISTTAAGSGHPTSCLSATDLLVSLMFGGYFKADLDNPKDPNNDRLIFSKGHAAPLLYALYAAAGKLTEAELKTLRKMGSPLEGHPTPNFPYAEAATGSLGQGLGIGVGLALNAKLDNLNYKTYVLLGDGEMAEGSVWEAMQIASYYKLTNLVGIVDVNGYGLVGPTMLKQDLAAYVARIEAFGWEAITVDGHNLEEICEVFDSIEHFSDRPVMIVAKTEKGAGINLSEVANVHGKSLTTEQLAKALQNLGEIDTTIVGQIQPPKPVSLTADTEPKTLKPVTKDYQLGELVATREAYGQGLVELASENPKVIVLDADLSTSTFANRIKEVDSNRFLEMFIAEQNMVSVATGLALRGKIPFCSSFGAFLTRALDQIRMARYSQANVKFVGSHAGVSIGEDGFSQMGLEDISMFRCILDSIVLYPSDAVSTKALVKEMAKYSGIIYLRTSRPKVPVIYSTAEQFVIGGSKTLRSSKQDILTIVAAGVTVHEALKAYEILLRDGIIVRVIDLYSVKPIDTLTLSQAAQETKAILVVEDHYSEGGVYGAVSECLYNPDLVKTGLVPIYSLAVNKLPRSGSSEELLAFVGIDAQAIVKKVNQIVDQLQ